MGKAQRTATAGDLSSSKSIAMRIFAMLDSAKEKMHDPDVTSSQLRLALIGLVMGLMGSPHFSKQKLLKIDGMILGDKSARKAESADVEALLPMFKLAEIAYEEDTDVLREHLKEQGYELHLHDKNVKTGDVGFYIALDHEEKVLLIGVKGTSSFADAITDCVAKTMPHWCTPNCPYSGNPDDREIRCHEGILTAAIKLCEDVEPVIKDMALRSGYKVKIVGHSLGAGAAALLAILLRSRGNEKFREPGYLHAWAFACPPVVDLESTKESMSFITSIVNKSDVVPRCSIANLEILTRLLANVANKMTEENGGKAVTGARGSLLMRKKDKEIKNIEPEEHLVHMEVLADFLAKSQSAVEVEHRDHLYVPGQVVLFYEKMDSPNADLAEGDDEKVKTCACIVDGSHKVRFQLYDCCL